MLPYCNQIKIAFPPKGKTSPGEGVLDKRRTSATAAYKDHLRYDFFCVFLRNAQDERIVHASIFPNEIASTLLEIQQSAFAPPSRHYRVLQKSSKLMIPYKVAAALAYKSILLPGVESIDRPPS